MEPQDLPKNDHTEGSGVFRRRISSILKANRKSTRFPDQEQQENVVERARLMDKRNSRRVSFAPADDVLLFSKDAKNTSPRRSPLQELMTAAGSASHNRVHVAIEEEIQPITAIETLLNAPLHASQQRDAVCSDSAGGFGEKTVMFSTEDALMDMTHCQTMLVSVCADASFQNCNTLDKSATDSSVLLLPNNHKRLSTEKKNTVAMSSDPGFEDFLFSVTQPPSSSSSSSATGTNGSVAHMKTQNKDKENLLPVMEKSLVTSREADLSPSVAEEEAGPVLSDSDDDNPFPFFFPSQESKDRSNKERLKTTTVTKSPPKDPVPSKNPPFDAPHQRPTVNYDGGDRTLRFAADEDFMDVTRSHTVSITRGPVPLQQAGSLSGGVVPSSMDMNRSVHVGTDVQLQTLVGPAGQDKTIRFDVDNAGMDMTRCFTAKIDNLGEDAIPPEIQRVDHGPLRDRSSSSVDMETTEAQTGQISPCYFEVYEPPGQTLKTKSKARGSSVNYAGLLNQDAGEKTTGFSVDDEGCMDVTQSHTVYTDTDVQLQSSGRDKTMRFDVNSGGMEVTRCLTVNIDNNSGSDSVSLPEKNSGGEKRVPLGDRSSASAFGFGRKSMAAAPFPDMKDSSGGDTVSPDADVNMDMTETQTGLGITETNDPGCLKNTDSDLRERTVRFSTDDEGCMDETRSHTSHIGTDLNLQSQPLSSRRDKTIRFDGNNGGMDLTCCLTDNNLVSLPEKNSGGEKRVPLGDRSSSSAFGFGRKSMVAAPFPDMRDSSGGDTVCPDADVRRDNTMRFDGDGGDMDETCCLTVNNDNNLGSDSVFPPEQRRESGVSFVSSAPERNSVTAEAKNPEGDVYMDLTEAQTGRMLGMTRSEEVDVMPTQTASDHREETLRLFPDDAVDSRPALDSVPADQESNIYVAEPLRRHTDSLFSVKKRSRSLAGRSLGLGMKNSLCRMSSPWIDPVKTAAPAAPLQDLSTRGCGEADPGPEVDSAEKTTAYQDLSMEMTEAQTGRVLGRNFGDELARSQDSDAEQTEATTRPSQETPEPTSSLIQGDAHEDETRSRTSRRISLADIQSKARRLSRMVIPAPDPDDVAAENRTAALRHFHDLDEKAEATPLPSAEPEFNTNEEAQDETREMEAPATPVPFNSKTTQLISRLSMGAFKPKLPQIVRPTTPRIQNPAVQETAATPLNLTKPLDMDVSDIFDEELDSVEDDVPESPGKEALPPQEEEEEEADAHQLSQEVGVDEDWVGSAQGKRKRELLEDEIDVEDEKRLKAESTEETHQPLEMGHVSDGNLTSGRSMSTITSDISDRTAGVRHEATFESTLKQSTMFESQLEDYTCDTQKRMGEETMTVLEFLKVFNIDFVIHHPRQSILPGRIVSEEDQTLLEALRDRHISRPRQLVYEADVHSLAERVEGLKVRLQDLDKPLLLVNRSLWEEMRNASNAELKSFGATLKQRNNIFRKTGKALSHEMKEGLYSSLVQANLEEQQKLRETIKEADEMIRSLDDCIAQLEAELTAVEETGFQDKPSLKSLQEEMKKITEAISENERQTSELEIQKKQNAAKVSKVKAEMGSLQEHLTTLHTLNEWRLGENQENCSVYSFLHDTLHLQLLYENSSGEGTERKISQINFKLQLDEERSRCHAHLVHKLLARHIHGQASWVEKYPTSRHVPKLLHDVSLVVSRCRLLGEELRLLTLWGGLSLHIVHISCLDTQVHVVFSSLKKRTKFEVVFDVCLTDGHCVVKVQSFKNVIGSTTIEQIEDTVASLGPSKNLLTKILKKIHQGLLW